MARLDYFAVAESIKTQLSTYAPLNNSNTKILVEEDVNWHEGDTVVVYLRRREAPGGMQALNAYTKVRMLLHFEIICVSFGMQIEAARERRNDLLSNVELGLMQDSTFANTQVTMSWMAGGTFEDGRAGQNQLYSAGSIELVVDATAVR